MINSKEVLCAIDCFLISKYNMFLSETQGRMLERGLKEFFDKDEEYRTKKLKKLLDFLNKQEI